MSHWGRNDVTVERCRPRNSRDCVERAAPFWCRVSKAWWNASKSTADEPYADVHRSDSWRACVICECMLCARPISAIRLIAILQYLYTYEAHTCVSISSSGSVNLKNGRRFLYTNTELDDATARAASVTTRPDGE